VNLDESNLKLRTDSKEFSIRLRQFRIRCRQDWAGGRLGRWLTRFVEGLSISPPERDATSLRRQSLVPRLTPLESRIVLNASAELSAATGLMILGDLANDSVRLNLVGNGDSIQLTDFNGTVIPIHGHHDGVTGSETDPLEISDISGGLVSTDLGGGDDQLKVQLHRGIRLNVVDGAGHDHVEIDSQPTDAPESSLSLSVAAESIDLFPSGATIDLANREVGLVGAVSVGSTNPSVVTRVDIGTGSLEIEGTLTLEGDVVVTSDSGDVDFSNATISASATGASLLVQFNPNSASTLLLGEFNDSAGHRPQDLQVIAADEAVFTADVDVQETLSVTALSRVRFDGDVAAGNIDVQADQIFLTGRASSDSGPITLLSADQLSVGGDLDSVSAATDGDITLGGASIAFSESTFRLAGADLIINGRVQLIDPPPIEAGFGPDGSFTPGSSSSVDVDGVEVTVVMPSDSVQASGNVTIVTRSGETLEIRSGDSFADAQSAAPTIRSIADLNGRSLSIDAVAPQSQLFLDVNGFVGAGANLLDVDVDFVFDTIFAGGDGSVFLYDSDLATADSPDQFDAVYDDAERLQLTFNHAAGVAPDYSIFMAGVTRIDLNLPSLTLVGELSEQNDRLTVVADQTPSFSVLQLATGTGISQFRFMNPAETLRIDARGGDDVLTFDSFGDDLIAVPAVIGGSGRDELVWNADVDVGVADSARKFFLDAESILVGGDIRLNGGGTIEINAVDELVVRSSIDSTAGGIVIDSDATISDFSAATLRSESPGVAVSLHGGDYLLGDVQASAGTLALGSLTGLGTIGSIGQADMTGISAFGVTAESSGGLSLDSQSNQIAAVELSARDDVTVLDSSGDLMMSVSAGESIDVQVAGVLSLANVRSDNGSVRLDATGDILGVANQVGLHVSGERVQLLSGVPFPGLPIVPVANTSIGLEHDPIRVQATSEFSASTSGTDGSIFVRSPLSSGGLPIGLVDAGNGRIVIDAASIDDAFASAVVDLIGSEIHLNADAGIGSIRTLTLTGLSELHASSVRGSIHLDLVADREIRLSQVTTGGGAGEDILIRHSGDHLLSIMDVSNANGSVSISTEVASIDVLRRSAGPALSAGGNGDILLENLGGASDITIRGEVESDRGDVSIAARQDLIFTRHGMLHSSGGSVSLVAGIAPGLPTGMIDLQDGSRLDVGSGSASLDAPGDIRVSSIRSSQVGEAISIHSLAGSIIDSGDAHPDLVADSGIVRLDAMGGIGNGNPLETEIDRLIALVRGPGDLQINEATSIELLDVVTTDGKIGFIAAGTITAQSVRSINASGQDGLSNRDIRLETTGRHSDILVGSVIGENLTDVDLFSGDDVLRVGSGSLLVGDDLRIESANQTSDSPDAVRLSTNVNDLSLRVLGGHRGDVQIDESDSIHLASSDRNDDSEVVSTTNGEIRVQAADSISIRDTGLVDDQSSLRGDAEIIAGGTNGRIRLGAGQSIRMGDSVQLKASQYDFAAVTVDAPRVSIGTRFQIETGPGVGIARIFAPRPEEGLSDTAFYDFNSIATTRLEQAFVNDAKGVLSVDVGNEGERGLTINIDWGAETGRFQQIDLLSGDAPPLNVEHVYTEQDIVSSMLNGRDSSTDNLQVRFSVRHHESILVRGDSIEQSTSGPQLVAGGVLSSTDNPLTQDGPFTPILENGRASFEIPALTIPVAFFPVRDVIPTFENETVVVTSEQTYVLLGMASDTTETVVVSSTFREEYFQIRVLSPDPEGDDLVPPARLPDDILVGDKLQKLFQSLPDGRYDIQYVLGDGSVRSIRSVDLRDGKPIQPGDDLEGGQLRLTPIDPAVSPIDLDLPPIEFESHGETDDSVPTEVSSLPDASDQSGRGPVWIRIDGPEIGRDDSGSESRQDESRPSGGRFSVAERLRMRGRQLQSAVASGMENN
jgi:hypothetical protein